MKQKAVSAKHNEVKMRFMPTNMRAELSRTFYLLDTGMEGGEEQEMQPSIIGKCHQGIKPKAEDRRLRSQAARAALMVSWLLALG